MIIIPKSPTGRVSIIPESQTGRVSIIPTLVIKRQVEYNTRVTNRPNDVHSVALALVSIMISEATYDQ